MHDQAQPMTSTLISRISSFLVLLWVNWYCSLCPPLHSKIFFKNLIDNSVSYCLHPFYIFSDLMLELAGERSFFDKLRQRLRRRGGLYLSSLLHCCKILPCVCASHIFHHNSCINDLYWPKLWFLWGYVLNVAVSR